MSLRVHLLGSPRLQRASAETYRFRSRKSWALLTYLALAERPPSRSQLASLLFAEADDPFRALRWSLSELRRGLDADGSVEGDPVVLRLRPTTTVDVHAVLRGSWADAVGWPGLGQELLDGVHIRGAPAFESWLLSQRRHVAAASEAVLHEAALGSMSTGALEAALGYAVRSAALSPLDENHQALLIRLYRLTGDDHAAERQYRACAVQLARELGETPGPVVEAARRTSRSRPVAGADEPAVAAVIEAGAAAVAAGAVEAGVESLRTATGLADHLAVPALQVTARLVLAEALIHSLRGLDEQGLAALYEVDELGCAHGLSQARAQARTEIGYVDFLRARYDRAQRWLDDAIELADGEPALTAKATIYLGCVASDRAAYGRAAQLLGDGVELARRARDPRREAYGLAMLGRVDLLRGELAPAAASLDAAVAIGERQQWLAFLPWPQALRGELQLRRGDPDGAAELLQQAFARACQLGDPCWEGMAARGLALVADSRGETARAFTVLVDALARCTRVADPYVWLEAYILQARCRLGVRHGHPEAPAWVEALQDLAARTSMRGFLVEALRLAAALGSPGGEAAVALIGTEFDGRPRWQGRRPKVDPQRSSSKTTWSKGSSEPS